MKTRSTGRTSSGPERLDQAQIGGIGVEHAATRVGHQDALVGVIDDCLEQRARSLASRCAQNAGREREQQEHADHGQHGQKREDVGLRLVAADEVKPARGPDEHNGDEQHQTDAAAAAAPARPVDRCAGDVLGQLLLRHDRRGIGFMSALP